MKRAIQRIFEQYGDEFIEANREQLTKRHLKAIRHIRACGTPEAGWIAFECEDCAEPHRIERSCGDRMCPSCQTAKTGEWLDKRLAEQLPTHYFLITFTVPKQLHPLFMHKAKEGFSALFAAASEAIKALASNPRFVGVDLPGFMGLLHTWGRTLNYHPHIHFVVPGGGIDKEKGVWRCAREDFFAPGQALAKTFKGLFHDQLEKAGLDSCVDPSVWPRKWVVDCEAVGQNREGVLKYLAPYVFKTAITDSRIVSVANRSVTFTYAKSGSRRQRRMTLDAHEFIRRYLTHMLPAGFMRIRHYGFMGSGCGIAHEELVALVRLAHAFEVEPIKHVPAETKPMLCPECGGRLVAVGILDSKERMVLAFDGSHPKRE